MVLDIPKINTHRYNNNELREGKGREGTFSFGHSSENFSSLVLVFNLYEIDLNDS